MASINLSGSILDPVGNSAVGDEIIFTHMTSTGETAKGSIKVLTIPPDGSYNIDLQYGLIKIDYRDYKSYTKSHLAVVTVDSTSTATNLGDLINSTTAPPSPELLQFQAILADCTAAKDEAQAAAVFADDTAVYLTEAEAISTDLPVNKYVRITDRDFALAKVESTGVADGFGIIGISNGNLLHIKVEGGEANIVHFGALGNGDGSTSARDRNSDAIDYCISYCQDNGINSVVVPAARGGSGAKNYPINRTITLPVGFSFKGLGTYKDCVFSTTGGEDFMVVSGDCVVENIQASEFPANQISANNKGIYIRNPDGVSRVDGVRLQSVKMRGYTTGYRSDGMWASVLDTCYAQDVVNGCLFANSLNSGTTNNNLVNCQFQGIENINPTTESYAIRIGGGVGTGGTEGWMITGNLTAYFAYSIYLNHSTNNIITENIFDFIYRGGIVSFSNLSVNQIIKDNYFGVQKGFGINLNSSDLPNLFDIGHKISGNTFSNYGGVDVDTAISLGEFDSGSSIHENTIKGDFSGGIKLDGGGNSIVNNKMNGTTLYQTTTPFDTSKMSLEFNNRDVSYIGNRASQFYINQGLGVRDYASFGEPQPGMAVNQGDKFRNIQFASSNVSEYYVTVGGVVGSDAVIKTVTPT